MTTIEWPKEPTCCGEPMIHNSFTSEYECAEAYFTLVDEEVITDWSPRHHNPSELPGWLQEHYEHWLTSMRPDGWDALAKSGGSSGGAA